MRRISAALAKRGQVRSFLHRNNTGFNFTFNKGLAVLSATLGLKWVICFYFLYYVLMPKKITLYYKKNRRNQEIMQQLKKLKGVFYPHILWLFPEVQTLACLVRNMPKNQCKEIEITQDDGGSFFVDIYEPATCNGHTVVLIHGLGGSSQSKYVKILGSHFLKENYRVAAMGARGTKHPLKTPVFFHIGWTKDLIGTFKYVLNTYPSDTVSGVGYSLGGHWMTKTFGELDRNFTEEEMQRIKGGMAISTPFDFVKLSKYMLNPIPKRIYNRGFADRTKKLVIRNREIFEEYGVKVDEILKAQTIHEVDALLTAKVFGIENMDKHYYDESCVRVVGKIKKPFLIFNSKDDPIIPKNTIPIKECTDSEHVILALTEKGGHMGFLGYNRGKSYAEEAALEFIRVIREYVDKDLDEEDAEKCEVIEEV